MNCGCSLVWMLFSLLMTGVVSDFLSEKLLSKSDPSEVVVTAAVSCNLESMKFAVWSFCLFVGSNVSSELRLCLRVPRRVVLSFIELSSFVEIESDSIGWIWLNELSSLSTAFN